MLTVAGAGPGSTRYMTLEVIQRIRSAHKVIAFSRIGEEVSKIRQDVVKVSSVDQIPELIEGERDCLLIASGDPLFYGIVSYLRKKKVKVHRVIPGISSFQYMMAQLGIDWQDAFLTSCHGRSLDLEGVKKSPLSVILLDRENGPTDISRRLQAEGLKGRVHAGSNLSYEDEEIVTVNIGEALDIKNKLTLVVIENETC